MNPTRPAAYRVFRLLCLATALANAGGNLALLLFYEPVYRLLGVPLPTDRFAFAAVSAFSLSVGVAAFMIWRDPEGSRSLLVYGAIAKGLYAFFTFYFAFQGLLHPFLIAFGVWDAAFTVVFLLFALHLASTDLSRLNAGAILPGAAAARTRRALLVYYSLSGNGSLAMERVRRGLAAGGYSVDDERVEAVEAALFRFPFPSLLAFVRIAVRAILRVPAEAKPLRTLPDHDYDLVVLECPTWFVGMSAPMEHVLENALSGRIVEGRDVAVVNVCRGLWRRTQAMTVRWVERRGGRVVGVRGCPNPGRDPMRTWSLFFFLGFGEPGRPRWLRPWLTLPHLGEESLLALEAFGLALAQRSAPAAGAATSRRAS
jgi:hypothetical protein